MADLKIYGIPASTFTRTVRLACHEKGVDYELVPMMPGRMGALNPFEKVPAIAHGEVVLFESTAILRYLDRTFPGPKLWPQDSQPLALCDQWVSAVNDSLVNSALRLTIHHLGYLRVPQEMAEMYLAKARDVVPVFDRQLGRTRYLVGDSVTAADLFLAPVAFGFPAVPGLKEIGEAAPNLGRWMRDMAGRPSMKATEPEPLSADAA